MTDKASSEAIIRRACPSWARLEGLVVHGWKVLGPIGRGGTAEVYRLQHEKDKSEGALKLLLPDFAKDADCQKLFLREADFLEDFNHQGIPKIFAQTTVLDRLALIMDYVPGDNLMTLLHQGKKLPPLSVLMAACKIISYLHEQNVIHNDIKLANFILSPKGRIHCVDFGSARRLSMSSTFFRRFKGSEKVQGTPSYLAPELIQGKGPSKSSDVWALGILAHYLHAGSAPFQGEDASQTLKMILGNPMPSLKSRCEQVDGSLSNIVDRCLIIDPQLRYGTATELLEILRRYRDGTASHRRPR
ncbi:MAG: serine/threonine protein kinase [Planctomycetota bacterium]|nr:MAG: serine/threonine protein kinase [Planctomycetota bacterium]